MKKNTSLYILLCFLIIVNGFFLYNYLGNGDDKKRGRPGDSMGFVIKQLKFDDNQMEMLDVLNEEHHRKMVRISNQNRNLKDALFGKLSDTSITNKYIDSITRLIGRNVAELDKEAFHHFRAIEGICTDKQKEKFKSIIKEAIGKGGRKNGPPPMKGERMRLPMDGRPMGPPPHGEHMGPPPNH